MPPFNLPLPPCPPLPLQASAHAAFVALIASVDAAASLDRPSRRAFGKALTTFVVDMRGAVNVR
jgi:hypothetical protein